jgi:hypothetical protein
MMHREIIAGTSCPLCTGTGPRAEKPGSGLAAHYFITLVHCGEAFTFVPSFTGGSILMFGP